jgi:hypothetical protein
MYKDEYLKKIDEFIIANNSIKLPNDVTNRRHIKTRKQINKCKNIIKKDEKWKYINVNPSAPCLYGTIQLHKQDKPIQRIVNLKNCPAYKVAKHLNKIL